MELEWRDVNKIQISSWLKDILIPLGKEDYERFVKEIKGMYDAGLEQLIPPVILHKGKLVGGYHRVRAYKQLGIKRIRVIIIPCHTSKLRR